MPYRVLSYQQTPNPNALKLMLDATISDRPRSFRTAADGAGDALAARFFAITGISGLLFSDDWMTVNKSPDAAWPAIKKAVERELAALP